MFSTSSRAKGRLCRWGAVLVMPIVASVIGASSAQANATYVTHPDGSRAYINYINGQHTAVTICDNDRDGHFAYVRFTSPGGAVESFYDRDGYGGYCSAYPVKWYYTTFNACVQAKGCGQPKYRPGFGMPTW